MTAQNHIIGDRIVRRSRSVNAPASIVRFPVLARRAFIAKIAAAMKRKRSDDAAEQYLADELRRYSRQLQKQGFPEAVVKREVCAMEPAVRGDLWRLMFGSLSGTE